MLVFVLDHVMHNPMSCAIPTAPRRDAFSLAGGVRGGGGGFRGGAKPFCVWRLLCVDLDPGPEQCTWTHKQWRGPGSEVRVPNPGTMATPHTPPPCGWVDPPPSLLGRVCRESTLRVSPPKVAIVLPADNVGVLGTGQCQAHPEDLQPCRRRGSMGAKLRVSHVFVEEGGGVYNRPRMCAGTRSVLHPLPKSFHPSLGGCLHPPPSFPLISPPSPSCPHFPSSPHFHQFSCHFPPLPLTSPHFLQFFHHELQKMCGRTLCRQTRGT